MDGLKKITLEELNSVVSRFIPLLNQHGELRSYLVSTGELYLNFLTGQHQQLSLVLPIYETNFAKQLLTYLHYLNILVKLSHKLNRPITGGIELFDYFSYQAADSYERSKGNFVLAVKNVIADRIEFDKHTTIRTDRFVPVFYEGAVDNHEASIFQAFPLFAEVAKSGLFPYPVLIDLDKDSIVILHNNMPWSNIEFLSESVNSSTFDDHGQRDLILESLIAREIGSAIAIRYPYHSNLDPIVCREMANRSKILEVTMCNRLFYQEITDDVVVMLPEIIERNLDRLGEMVLDLYQIADTHHSADLFSAMALFKDTWKDAGLNSYQYPFPSRWLMLVHQGEPLAFYLDLLGVDFPLVKGKLRKDFEKVVELVYAVNWLEEHLPHQRDGVLLLPTMNSYPQILESAREYLKPYFREVVDAQTYLSKPGSINNTILLDPFNKLLICNKLFQPETKGMRVAVPDFLFFGYQPFICYYLAKYLFDPLVKGARKYFDLNHDRHLTEWERVSSSLIAQARESVRSYAQSYLVPCEPEEIPILEEETQIQGLSKLEVTELLKKVASSGTGDFMYITTTVGKTYHLKVNAVVLVNLQGEIHQIAAGALTIGQRFALADDYLKTIDRQALSENLSRISEQARLWKQQMANSARQNKGLYAQLKELGLSIQETTFENVYLDSNDASKTLSLPRSRKDWQIVGDFLDIPDISRAWINHKGWSSVSALRSVYGKVIKVVLEYYASEVEDENALVERVNQLIFGVNDTSEDILLQNNDAREIINAVAAHITFYEITNIQLL